ALNPHRPHRSFERSPLIACDLRRTLPFYSYCYSEPTYRLSRQKGTTALRIDHWKGGRFFALYDDDDDLVAVFVYRKGAEAVRTKFEEFKEVINATANRGVARFSTTTPQPEPK